MKTTELYTLIAKQVNARLVNNFTYSYDADRRFREIHIYENAISKLDKSIAILIANSGHEAVETRVCKIDGNVYDIIAVRPIKGSDSIEWC